MNTRYVRSHLRRSRGFSLIEAVMTIVVLAVSVPPATMWLTQAANDRADAANATKAAVLATSIMETTIADTFSTAPSLGLANVVSAAYLTAPVTGLRIRANAIVAPLLSAGLEYQVTVGTAVDVSGSLNVTSGLNLYRPVAVTVTYQLSSGGTADLTLATFVTSFQ